MNRDEVVAEVNALRLPHPDGVIIVAGTAMAMIGLRTTSDIDLLVDERNWRYLAGLAGWTKQTLGPDRVRLVDSTGKFDVWSVWVDKRVHPYKVIDFREIEPNTYIDTSGYRIPTTAQQIMMKRQLARKKDAVDIKMLEQGE